jgi:nucleotide-binding universal stress UspA family protein
MEKKNIMRKVLVGFDGSKGSENALNRAMTLIDEYGELILLAVVPGPEDKAFVDNEIYNKLKKKAEILINTTISDLGEHDYEITGMIKEGDPASVIIDISNKLRVDLIVLGSKGSSELGNYPIGSVANKVVQYAAIPVMVVR